MVDSCCEVTVKMLYTTNIGQQAVLFGMSSILLMLIWHEGYLTGISSILTSLRLCKQRQDLTIILPGIHLDTQNKMWTGQAHHEPAAREEAANIVH